MLSNCGAGEDSRVTWTEGRPNQSILKEINLEFSLEGLVLKLQYFGHLVWRADSWKRLWCWERLRVNEKMEGEDEMVRWHHWLTGHEFEQAPGDGEGQGRLARCSLWGQKELDTTEQLSNNGSLSVIYTHSLLANILHWMYSCLDVYLENLENEPVNPYHIFGSLEFYTVEVDRWERKEYISRRK